MQTTPPPHRQMPHPLPRVGHFQPCIIGNDNDAIIGILGDGQQRPLDPVYPVLFIDCINVKIRDGNVATGRSTSRWR